jgi:ATP/maltotriose-dependent transcriptional regulator MalT
VPLELTEEVAALLALPAARHEDRVRARPALKTPAAFQALVARWEAHHRDPDAALSIAVAGRLASESVGERFGLDCQALARSLLAACALDRGDLRTAAAELARAESLAVRGSGDPLLLASLLRRRGALERAKGKRIQAAARFGAAAALYQEILDHRRQGETLLEQAGVLDEARRLGEAYEAFFAAIEALRLAGGPALADRLGRAFLRSRAHQPGTGRKR